MPSPPALINFTVDCRRNELACVDGESIGVAKSTQRVIRPNRLTQAAHKTEKEMPTYIVEATPRLTRSHKVTVERGPSSSSAGMYRFLLRHVLAVQRLSACANFHASVASLPSTLNLARLLQVFSYHVHSMPSSSAESYTAIAHSPPVSRRQGPIRSHSAGGSWRAAADLLFQSFSFFLFSKRAK